MTEQILAVQKMQDYIESHLTEEITLAALADICSFSPWYAHRYGCIRSASRPNIRAIADGGIRRPADPDGSCTV